MNLAMVRCLQVHIQLHTKQWRSILFIANSFTAGDATNATGTNSTVYTSGECW